MRHEPKKPKVEPQGCQVLPFLTHELARHVPGCAACTALLRKHVYGQVGRKTSAAKAAGAQKANKARWDRYYSDRKQARASLAPTS